MVNSGWSKEVSINARSSSLPCKYPGWIGKGEGEVDGNMGGVLKAQRAIEFKEGGEHDHVHVQGPPTAAVSVSRLFFENKVKEIADSISSSPRGSLTLPKREWGYSPYATPPKRSVYSSQSLSNLDQSDECSTSTSTDGGRQRERGREVVSLGNFAERKAFFQGNTSTPGKGHILAASTANTDGCPCSSAIPVCMRVPERQMQRVVSPRDQQQQQHALGGAHSPSHSQQQRDRDRDCREERNITTAEGSMSALGAEVCIVKSVRVRDIVKSWSSVVRESSVIKSKKNEMAHVSQLHFVRLNEVAIIGG